MRKEALQALVDNLGQKYSDVLGIKLADADDREISKWFLASLFFGAPIAESSVFKTYRCFKKYGVLMHKKILQIGRDGLVQILDEGSYTRYDFKTADKLMEVMRNLETRYDGSFTLIHSRASDPYDLEERLKDLGKGVGDVTVGIFLRELRGVWEKADPCPTPLVIEAAQQLGIVGKKSDVRKVLNQLKVFWKKNEISGKSFVNFETALLRLDKDYFRKGKSPPFL